MQGSNGRTSWLWGAAAVGGFHAGMSLHWALGGTWLADTVGVMGDRVKDGQFASAATVLGAAALLKGVVAFGPLMARPWTGVLAGGARTLAIFAGVVLAIYGTVLTVVGLVALTGVWGVPSDPLSLRGHALFWDPLFALWGGLLLGGIGLDTRLRRCRRRRMVRSAHASLPVAGAPERIPATAAPAPHRSPVKENA